MKLVYTDVVPNQKSHRPTKLQAILDEFMNSGEKVARCVFSEGEYASTNSAQKSYKVAIDRLRYPIIARAINGVLYLIRVSPDEIGGHK